MDPIERTAAPTKAKYRVIGVMSGSSLDGIDLAICDLRIDDGRWKYEVLSTRTVAYSETFQNRLTAVMEGSALELARLHVELGKMIGTACKELLAGGTADLIASHGHTIFHKPGEGLTTQIGCGANIAAITGITTICDFRTMDVALGGQGAPLVPLGEKLLLPDNDCFINLGGISNISFHKAGSSVGYDIGPCNMALNLLANEQGLPYDADGRIASSGEVLPDLLRRLNALPFYQQEPPRSLGREWFEVTMEPLIGNPEYELPDRMRTVAEHIAVQLARELEELGARKVMITGGGNHNRFLLDRLKALSNTEIHVVDDQLIDYKEALIFALLGVLRIRGEVNALASVTGAKRDSVSGAIY